MPAKKTRAKKTTAKSGAAGGSSLLQRSSDKLSSAIRKVKSAYKNADPETRRKILAGLAGAAAMLAGTMAARKGKK